MPVFYNGLNQYLALKKNNNIKRTKNIFKNGGPKNARPPVRSSGESGRLPDSPKDLNGGRAFLGPPIFFGYVCLRFCCFFLFWQKTKHGTKENVRAFACVFHTTKNEKKSELENTKEKQSSVSDVSDIIRLADNLIHIAISFEILE